MSLQEKIKNAKRSDWFDDMPRWKIKLNIFIGQTRAKIVKLKPIRIIRDIKRKKQIIKHYKRIFGREPSVYELQRVMHLTSDEYIEELFKSNETPFELPKHERPKLFIWNPIPMNAFMTLKDQEKENDRKGVHEQDK